MVVLLEPARSADPPQSSGSAGAIALMVLPDAERVAIALGVGLEAREAVGRAVGQRAPLCIRSKSAR